MIRSICLAILFLLAALPSASVAQTEDAKQKLHLVFIGPEGSPQYEWFFKNSDLATLKERCAWSYLKPTDSIFKEKFEPVVGNNFPMVLLMRPDGGLIHSATGTNMPRQASVLFADIKASYQLAKTAKPAEQVTEQFSESSSPPCVGPNCPLPARTPDAFPVVDSRLLDFGKLRIRDSMLDQVDSMADRATYQIAGAVLVGFLMLLVGLGLLLILLRR